MLDKIEFSCSLTMVETMTYFEAYRPVLNALQTIAVDQAFPLESFILKLNNGHIPPNYVTPTTTYDFTPLLVDPKSKVKAVVNQFRAKLNLVSHFQARRDITPILDKTFHINYQNAALVSEKYKAVNLLDSNQWPTSDELHLNPKQREALMLALTHKVALIQGRKSNIDF